jgi:hypothetical protein
MLDRHLAQKYWLEYGMLRRTVVQNSIIWQRSFEPALSIAGVSRYSGKADSRDVRHAGGGGSRV